MFLKYMKTEYLNKTLITLYWIYIICRKKRVQNLANQAASMYLIAMEWSNIFLFGIIHFEECMKSRARGKREETIVVGV